MLFAQGTLILLASSGFQRQKEIIHACFLCNKPVLAVAIIVLITLNHVSFLHYASKVPVGKVSREISCLPNRQIYLLWTTRQGIFLPWKQIIKFLVRGGCSSDFSQLSQEVYWEGSF